MSNLKKNISNTSKTKQFNEQSWFIKHKQSLFIIIIICVSFITFANTLTLDFAFDDEPNISLNKYIKTFNLNNIWNLLSKEFHSSVGSSGLYRPIPGLFFLLGSSTTNEKPFIFHLFNILVHCGVCLLVYLLAKNILKNEHIAFLSALIFATSPVHTEVVANATSLSELLSSFFPLLSIYFYIKSRNEKKGFKKLLLAFFFFLLGLLSKENAVTFIIVYFMYDLFFTDFIQSKPSRIKSMKKYLVFVIILLFYIFIRWQITGRLTVGALTPFVDNPLVDDSLSIFERLGTILTVFGTYLRLLIIPFPLLHDYSYAKISICSNWLTPEVLIPLFVLFISIFSVIYYYKRNRQMVFFIIMFYASYSIISNTIMVIGTIIGERLIYASSIGFYILLIFLLFIAFQKLFKNKSLTILYPLMITVCIVFSVLTFSRNFDWNKNETLYISNLDYGITSTKFTNNAGLAFRLSGSNEKAIEYGKKSIQILPESHNTYLQLGLAYINLNDFDNALKMFNVLYNLDVKEQFKYKMDGIYYSAKINLQKNNLEQGEKFLVEMIENPQSVNYANYLDACYTLGKLYTKDPKNNPKVTNIINQVFNTMLQFGDLEPIKYIDIHYYTALLQFDMKNYSEVEKELDWILNNTRPDYKNFFEVLFRKGFLELDIKKNVPKALSIFQQLLQIKPDHYQTLFNLGAYFYNNKDYNNAMMYFEQLKRYFPRDPQGYLMQAQVFISTNKLLEAKQVIQQLLSIDPNNNDAKNILMQLGK